jgi:hypothetical protein
MKHSAIAAVLSFVIGSATTAQAQVHEPARMLATPTKEAPAGPSLSIQREVIVSDFKVAYEKTGEPNIAVFWNRKFDDQLSQWYQEFRMSRTGEASVQGQDKFEPQGGDDPAYQRNVSGGGKIVSSIYAESRAAQQSRAGFGESEGFEFASGFTSTLISVPAKIIDREAIMRLVQRDNAEEAGAEMISDYQKIETDSLIGYADYLAEVLLTPDSSGDTGWAFMVTVKSVSDGRVVSMFKSVANNPFETPPEERWVATNEGYEKVVDHREIGSPTQVGEQLAYEMMQSLTKVWK